MAKAEKVQEDLFEEDDDFEVDVIDDRPEEDQVPPKKNVDGEDDPDDIPEDELSTYSDGVQKRIKRLRYEYHEERRAREAASKQSEEAVRYAQSVHQENSRLKRQLEEGSTQLNEVAKARHDAEMGSAQKAYRDAFESGDTDALMEAQNKINDILLARATSARPAQPVQQMPVQPQAQPQQTPASMVPDQKFVSWSRKNGWFGQNPEMTSFAYGVHERLVKGGVDPQSADYYDKIDARMRQVFPDEFDSDYSVEDDSRTVETQTATQRKKPTVAPGGRGNGKPPRKVQLTRTQVAVAKRLGLTPEQYAKQVAKEMANGA